MRVRTAAVVCALALGAWAQQKGSVCDINASAARDHFREANAKLAEQKPDRRVVFLGGSMFDGWDPAKTFADKDHVNRSISGQGTAQLLLRFNQDVAALRPRVLVIAPGTDDIVQGVGFADVQQNLIMVAQLAKAHGMRVVFASLVPTNPKGSSSLASVIAPERIRELNKWMFLYAKDHGDTYIDLWSPLGDDKAVLKPEYSADGVTLNEAAWKAVMPVIEKRIGEAVVAPAGRLTVKGE